MLVFEFVSNYVCMNLQVITHITFNSLGIFYYTVGSLICKKIKKVGKFMNEIFNKLLILNSNSSIFFNINFI
jgi:hypothetical protein